MIPQTGKPRQMIHADKLKKSNKNIQKRTRLKKNILVQFITLFLEKYLQHWANSLYMLNIFSYIKILVIYQLKTKLSWFNDQINTQLKYQNELIYQLRAHILRACLLGTIIVHLFCWVMSGFCISVFPKGVHIWVEALKW